METHHWQKLCPLALKAFYVFAKVVGDMQVSQAREIELLSDKVQLLRESRFSGGINRPAITSKLDVKVVNGLEGARPGTA